MKNIEMGNIVFKSSRLSKKRGYLDVKYRVYIKHPLTLKRWEIVSKWYTTSETYYANGKIKISAQLLGVIRRELQEKVNNLYIKYSQSNISFENDLTIEKVWSEWHQDRVIKKKVAPKTLAGEEERFYNHILTHIPPTSLLSQLNSEIIQKILDKQYPLGNHKRIAQSIKSDLNSLYKFAIQKNYIKPEQNPMPYVQIENKGLDERIKQLQKNKIDDSYLEKEELSEVLKIIYEHNPQYGRILEFQSLTGMRIGEVLGLKRKDIDIPNKVASVVRTRATHGGASLDNYIGNVKNEQSYRKVDLSDRALKLLKEEIIINEHHINGNPDYIDNDWIFTSKNQYKTMYNGTPIHYSVINNFLNSSETGKKTKSGHIKRVGINIDQKISFNKHISTHIFRHTHISYLAEKNVPLEAIQERVGHTKGSKVTQIYLHVTKNMKKDITSVIDSLTDNKNKLN
ncbi:tyrosine-type recombinase/integrase [Streptococcus uberis]|uniref:tyrosine-type recombinase/integrase n=1 Tax=Streptococcus uberis TaxID=1349 RepID=UPI001FF17FDE|nr:site-specific integrase [Streptococcus uberis]MCK1223182.1 site-specific integrase [Streptococcus uberis]